MVDTSSPPECTAQHPSPYLTKNMPCIQALQEAGKHLASSRSSGRDERTAALAAKAAAVQQFLGARAALVAGDGDAAVAACQQLLTSVAQASGSGAAGSGAVDVHMPLGVHEGDVLALLVQHCWALGDVAQSHGLCEEMVARGICLEQHVQPELLQSIYQVGGKLQGGWVCGVATLWAADRLCVVVAAIRTAYIHGANISASRQKLPCSHCMPTPAGSARRGAAPCVRP